MLVIHSSLESGIRKGLGSKTPTGVGQRRRPPPRPRSGSSLCASAPASVGFTPPTQVAGLTQQNLARLRGTHALETSLTPHLMHVMVNRRATVALCNGFAADGSLFEPLRLGHVQV